MIDNKYPYLSNKEIESRCIDLIDKFSKSNDMDYYNVPVLEMLEHLGYDIDFRSDGIYADSNILGGLIKRTKTIEVNAILENQPGRLHFTIAHEIGHIILHSEMNDTSLNRKIKGCNDENQQEKKNPIEVQADKFAAHLLMPTSSVKKLFFKSHRRPVDVSKRSLLEFIFPKSKKKKTFMLINKILSSGAFKNVSKMALINRLIGLRLLKGIEFQKNKVKEY